MRVCGAVICNCKVVKSNLTGKYDLEIRSKPHPSLGLLLYIKERSV
jgi:hypothetical protein